MIFNGLRPILRHVAARTMLPAALFTGSSLSAAGPAMGRLPPNGFVVVVQGRSAWQDVAWSIAPPTRLALVLTRDAKSVSEIRAAGGCASRASPRCNRTAVVRTACAGH